MISWVRQRRRGWKIVALLSTIAGVLLAFVPLFNLIGYESAAFFGVLLGFSTPYIMFDELAWRGWAAQLVERLALAVVPFVVLTLNAAIVKNCDYLTGVGFWLLIVGGSIMCATTLGWVVRCVIDSPRKGHAVIAVLMVLSVVEFGVRLAVEPPITGHHWALGYFSGSIYDEALSIPHSLVWYRGVQALACAAIVLLVTAFQSRSRHVAAASLILVVAVFAGFSQRKQHGVDRDRAYIVEALGGVIESEHFIIHYAARPPLAADVDRLVEDHEFRYAEMKAYFGTDPVALHGEKVRSFVYADRDQKGGLMGARRTLVAKIWLREIHILWRHYGDHMLAHELAHVFTEPFGTGPLRLSTRGWVLTNMGLVEGVATAADWDSDALDPHRASAALREIERAPDIKALVGASGFWTQSSGLAYTLMGSFVQWLVDQHGMAKFQKAYGHADFHGAYGIPAEELVEQWGKFVDAIELDENEIELARYLYDRKSIFQKVCARTIGDLRVRMAERARARDARAARELMEQIVRWDPDNPDYQVEHARLLLSLGDAAAAREILTLLLDVELDAAQRVRVTSLLGDALWSEGNVTAAGARYEECLGRALPINDERLLLVKHRVLEGDDPAEPFAYHYLLDTELADNVRLFFPMEWAKRHEGDPLADYLIGRRLWSAREWDWAEPYLVRALEVPAGALREEAQLMLIQTLHFAGRGAEARAILTAWSPRLRPYVAAREEWKRRIDWSSR